MPTIRERMYEYNELVRLANTNGITRGPDGTLLHVLTNLRCSNADATARVETLRTHIQNLGVNQILALGSEVSTTIDQLRYITTPRTRAPRTRSVRSSFVSRLAAARQQAYVPPPARSTTEPTFGVELECLFPASLTTTQIATALNTAGIPAQSEVYNHAARSHWKIVTDGSLRANPNTVALEIVSPVLTGEAGLAAIAKVCETLTSIGAVVNRSCGLHVHVGVLPGNDNAHFFRRLADLYKNHNPIIEQVLAPSRRGSSNLYCRPLLAYSNAAINACNSVADVIRLVNGNDPRADRYYKLNLNSYFRHRTVEFRQHQGTLDGQKAIMWTRFCLKMVAAANKTEAVTSNDLMGLLQFIEANEDERNYFLGRQSHFVQLSQGEE